ncbi:MAG TPA: T9SS type A sorting domain-containing protein [Chitinophagaceae bacterium]|nr:T9SS type A sorting domain-containing protein [Chitinophagaceae bacterium]
MKKYAGLLIALIVINCNVKAQSSEAACSSTSTEIHFTGAAPFPWAIDGKTTDWETIIGKVKGNKPQSLNENNWFLDGNPTDLDNPPKDRDIELAAYTYDSYNTYLYLQFAQKPKSNTGIFYFIDVNVDGYMNAGEPVISVCFDKKGIANLNLLQFEPNETLDYEAGFGNFLMAPAGQLGTIFPFMADGYTVKGSTVSVTKERSALKKGELFTATVTGNGQGIEMAIPWSLLKNWITNQPALNDQSVFLYNIAVQAECGPYDSKNVVDNWGQSNEVGLNIGRVGSPKACLQKKSVQTLVSGYTYRFKIELNNPTNADEDISIKNIVFNNIKGKNGTVINERDFIVTVYTDVNCDGSIEKESPYNFVYGGGSIAQQPIIYRSEGTAAPYLTTKPASTACFIIDVILPPKTDVSSAEINIVPGVKMPVAAIGIGMSTLDDGGKPITPIGFTFDEFNLVQTQKSKAIGEVEINESLTAFPNPGKGSLSIILPYSSGSTLRLVNSEGKIIKSWDKVTEQRINVSGLKKGFYILQVFGKGGFQAAKKIIVQ